VNKIAYPYFDEGDFPSWPYWNQDERERLLTALESGHWAGSRARYLPQFAKRFARFHDAADGICLANGTVSLEAALVACGIGEGDEVIVPAITFVATAGAVLRVNATPVVVDVDAESLCIDPEGVAAAITSRTRALIPVHVSGAMCDMDRLQVLCGNHNLAMIEDCAHAHGSAWRGIGAGAHGQLGSFSFQHSKLMSSGEGGALISSDADLLERAWNYANCGRARNHSVYHHASLGSNCRMTEWQAAILSAQLDRYPEQRLRRSRAARRLDTALGVLDGVSPQARDPRMTAQGYYCYVFHVDSERLGVGSCETMFTCLTAAGVPLSLAYPALLDVDFLSNGDLAPFARDRVDLARFDIPRARAASKNTIWIHHRALLAEDHILDRIVEVIAEAARAGAAGVT
jgi:dTDP-4-amino-4,6-dideoxygalactose transaminase